MASLKILSMNCNSIIGKIDTIRAHVETYKPDLVSITETKIDARFQDNELLGENFTIWRKDRKQGAGGVLVAVCNDSNVSILNSVAGPGESICLVFQYKFTHTLSFVLLPSIDPQMNTILITLNIR